MRGGDDEDERMKRRRVDDTRMERGWSEDGIKITREGGWGNEMSTRRVLDEDKERTREVRDEDEGGRWG